MNLKGNVVVITGASSGLGQALAEAFHREGCRVIASANDKARLASAAQKLDVLHFTADVTREKDVANLAGFALRKFGRIDIWINNAGITVPNAKIETLDTKRVHEVMEVNFFGTFYSSLKAAEIMKKQKRGTIANIISVRALEGNEKVGVYPASKWAVRGLTEALQLSIKPKSIRVIAVYPSAMKTHLWGRNRPADYRSYMDPAFVARDIVHNLKRRAPKSTIVIRKT